MYEFRVVYATVPGGTFQRGAHLFGDKREAQKFAAKREWEGRWPVMLQKWMPGLHGRPGKWSA